MDSKIQDRQPTRAEVMRYVIRSELRELHFGMPAEVLAYDGASRTCTVQPLGDRMSEDGEAYALPPLEQVPTLQLAWGGFEIYAPLKAGQHVWLHFAERSLQEWRNGRTTPPRARDILRLGDAVAQPGLSAPRGSHDDEGEALVIRSTDGGAIVLRSDGSVELGASGATDPVVRRSDLQAAIDSIADVFDAHTHPAPGGTTSPTETFIQTTAQGSSKVTSA